MTVLGISCYYHDSAAALVIDGRVVAAAAEERFSRIKHDNAFPVAAIAFCLSWATLNIEDVDEVVFYEKPIWKFDRVVTQHLESFPKSGRAFVENIDSWLVYKLRIPTILKDRIGYKGPVTYVPHHLSHAAASFYPSPFSSAVIITADGVGEWATTTVGVGFGNKIRIDKEIRFPHSLGLLYNAITAYLGFDVNDAEYKVMGLAAYGSPDQFRPHFKNLISRFSDGSFALNMKYFTFVWSGKMYGRALESLFGYPARPKESPIQPHHSNIAASLQETLEETMFSLCNSAYAAYHNPNVCLSGGVALNSVMNGKILSRTKFRRIYIPPDPGDAGCSIGAALHRSINKNKKRQMINFSPSLGPEFSDSQIKNTLLSHNLPFVHIENRADYLQKVARLLVRQKVVGWFQGRMEWGPRALGNRSILAAATNPRMKEIINTKVKHREAFRPFAPAILASHVSSYFKIDPYLSPSLQYMLMVYPFLRIGAKKAPATVHVDGTGRVQLIHRINNPLFYDLIEVYHKKTNIPIVLNTSFNVRGEPIVCTPRDAIQCFLNTDIDYLAIGSFLVKKRK